MWRVVATAGCRWPSGVVAALGATTTALHQRCRTSTSIAGSPSSSCLLCDADVEDWPSHASSASHVARHLVCSTLVVPERHEALMGQLWEHIQLDFQQLDEVAAKKEARRRGRLTSTMQYLKEQRIIRDSLIVLKPSGGDDGGATAAATSSPPSEVPSEKAVLAVGPRFTTLLALGTTFVQREVLDRVTRLFPSADGPSLLATTAFILSQRNLVHIFQLLGVATILPVPVERVRTDERAALLLSMLGELQLSSRQKRQRNVADKAVADALVLNVLATHLMDNMLSELTHYVLQKIVDEGTPVWHSYREQLTKQTLSAGNATPPLPLMTKRFPPSSAAEDADDRGASKWEACQWMCRLEQPSSERSAAIPRAKCAPSSTDMVRMSPLDMTVPQNAVKNSMYAVCAPRLAAKKRVAT